jgi:hypothetical protein
VIPATLIHLGNLVTMCRCYVFDAVPGIRISGMMMRIKIPQLFTIISWVGDLAKSS